MKILTKDEFFVHKKEYLKKILDGAVFIYPTDTIYGIGCDATNENAVAKIRKIKERYDAPLSVIAPNKEWIEENCEVFGKGHDYLKKLPGKYTLIFALKHEDCVAFNVNHANNTKNGENTELTLGVRIPNHWISEVVKELDIPIITTSVNRHGESFLTNISHLPAEIRNKVDFAIDVEEIKGTPSQVVDLVSGDAIVKR